MTVSKDPLEAVALELKRETAEALGRAGRRLQRALEALVAFDNRGEKQPGRTSREELLDQAAQALHDYTVQKELLGIGDEATLRATYDIPAELWARVGAVPKKS